MAWIVLSDCIKIHENFVNGNMDQAVLFFMVCFCRNPV